MKTSFLLAFVLLLTSGGLARALSVGSPFTAELYLLGELIRRDTGEEGRFPESWEELSKRQPDLDKDFPMLTPTRRMVLLVPPVRVTGGYREEGMAVAMTRDPYRDIKWRRTRFTRSLDGTLGPPHHAFIVLTDNGSVSLLRMSPESMPGFLRGKGLEPPAPSGLGAFPHEKRYEKAPIPWMPVTLGLAGLAAVCWLTWRSMRDQDHIERTHLPCHRGMDSSP